MDAQRRIKLLPRLKKGSFQRIVSNNKPIVPGKMPKIRIVRPERVKPVETVKVEEPKEPPKEEPPKVVDEPSMPIPAPMSETEERMADLLEVAQETKEIADKAAEIERAEGKSAEASSEVWDGSLPKGEPELPLEVPHEEPRKKKRGRKGRRGK